MNLRTIKRFLRKLSLQPKKARRKDIISLYQGDSQKFHKRRKKAISGFFRRFAIPFSKTNVIIYAILIGFGCIGGLVVLVTGPFFEIKNIYITRQNTNVNIDMAYTAVDSIRGKKSFLLDTDTIENSILKNQKSIKDISTSLQFPDNVNINILAYESVFQTHIGDKPYEILENGSVIPLEGSSQTPYLIVYQDVGSLSNIPDYKKIFPPTYIEAIQYLKNSLIENIIELQIAGLHYYVAERELTIELTTGGDIIFDLTRDLPTQIEKIAIFHEEGGNLTTNTLVYIDARILNKLFYCDTTAEYLCRINLKNIYGDRKVAPTSKEDIISDPQSEVSS